MSITGTSIALDVAADMLVFFFIGIVLEEADSYNVTGVLEMRCHGSSGDEGDCYDCYVETGFEA